MIKPIVVICIVINLFAFDSAWEDSMFYKAKNTKIRKARTPLSVPNGYQASNVVQYQQPNEKKYSRDPALDLPNTCTIGIVQAIWEGDKIKETYCRCPDGSYGYTCSENFINPCAAGQQYHPADPRLPKNYFVICSWTTPYLLKCPAGTVWKQDIYLCDWDTPSIYGYPSSMSQSYNQPSMNIPNYNNPTMTKPISASVETKQVYPQMTYQAPISAQNGARLAPLTDNQQNLNHHKVNNAAVVKTLSNKQHINTQVNKAADNKNIVQPTIANQKPLDQQTNAIKPSMQLNNMQQQQNEIRSILRSNSNNPLYHNLLYNPISQYGK